MTDQSRTRPERPSAPAEQEHERASSRSNIYGLLALVFRDAPTPELVARLRAPPLTEALRGLGCDVAEDLAGELETVTDRLAEEYTRIFVGPGPSASPYGSLHHEGEARLWGDSTVRVKRFIEKRGLSFQENWGSIPDHIAVELEVMQRLTAREAELWAESSDCRCYENAEPLKQLGQCLRAEEEFLRDHLCAWAPQFCDRVLERSVLPLYGQMAELTKSVVLGDLAEVALAEKARVSSSRTCPGRHSGTSQHHQVRAPAKSLQEEKP
jgi:TorA maturation chaperone TorD